MPKLTVLPHPDYCPEGAVIEDAPKGVSICRVLLDNHIDIEHACELSCACTTCHVVVKQGYASLEDATDDEEDLLDKAWGCLLYTSTLLGVTGSGKTYTMANVIAQLGRPALVLAPNKTLAAQLYAEMREFFPKNAVEYFVSCLLYTSRCV